MVDASVSYGASGGGVYSARTGNLVGLIEGYRTARVSFQVDSHTGQIDVPVPGETYVVSLAQIRRFLAATGDAVSWDDARVRRRAPVTEPWHPLLGFLRGRRPSLASMSR